MKLRIFTEPQQGADYQTLRNMALAAEELGFDAFFRSDHYLAMGDAPGLPGPTDSWATLTGLAVETSRIRLGTLMTAATFRRAAAIGLDPDDLRERGLGGTPGEVAAKIAEFAEIGAERIYLQVLDLADLGHLELIASDVAPQV